MWRPEEQRSALLRILRYPAYLSWSGSPAILSGAAPSRFESVTSGTDKGQRLGGSVEVRQRLEPRERGVRNACRRAGGLLAGDDVGLEQPRGTACTVRGAIS